jgi:hypothetical protein
VSADDRDEEREREIDDLLKGKGAPPAGKGSDRRSGLEDLLGSRSVDRPAGSSTPAGASHSSRSEARSGERSDRSGGPAGDGRTERQGATGFPPEPRDKARLPFNYSALIAILVAFVAVFILVNALRNTESGTVGIGSVGIGEKVDPFAVPLAVSDLEGDANVDPEEACRVAGEDVLRICDYFDRPLLVSFWFTGGASECIDQQNIFDQVAGRFRGRVGAVSINVRDDRARVRELVEERGWKVLVGHDTDGAVSNMYRVGGCPTFLFIKAGGVLERAEIGRTTVGELSSQVRSFLNGQ